MGKKLVIAEKPSVAMDYVIIKGKTDVIQGFKGKVGRPLMLR